MSLSSRESRLQEFRAKLAQLNFNLLLALDERKIVCREIQATKTIGSSNYPHYDPEREKVVFQEMMLELRQLSIRELLAFSLIMEEHAQGERPGAYPAWSQGVHLNSAPHQLLEMINPLLLSIILPEVFPSVELNQDFLFLKDF
jgi:chorismate mutase